MTNESAIANWGYWGNMLVSKLMDAEYMSVRAFPLLWSSRARAARTGLALGSISFYHQDQFNFTSEMTMTIAAQRSLFNKQVFYNF